MVYTDPNIFNYAELNDVIRTASDGGIFSFDIVIDGNSCMKQLPYMICQSVYPRCNSTTQALLPVCTDHCTQMIRMCEFGFIALNTSAFINPLFEVFVIDCTNQFRAFGSVTVDSESCYHFYCKT